MTQKKTAAAKAPIPKTAQKTPARSASLVAKAPMKKDAKAAPAAKVVAAKSDKKIVKKAMEAPKAVAKSAPASAKVVPVAKRPEPKVEAVKVAPKKAIEPVKAAPQPVAKPTVGAKPVAAAAAVPMSRPAPVAAKPVAAAAAHATPPASITAPAAPKIAAPAVTAAAIAAAAAAKKPVSARHGFKTNEWIVYPAHGVGRIVAIEEQEIANMSLELFVITFEKDKMTLRVPTGKAQTVGMRKLADEGIVKRAMETLKGKARIKRTMWSRRAQEFEAKINSGDLVSIAEVVRDLFRADNQPEQSYSERQLYEAALDRMAREIAAVDKLDERGAVQRITEVLSKSAKGRRAAAEEAAADAGIEAA